MPRKNDSSEPRPVPTAPDETAKKSTATSSSKAPAKASARTKSSAKAAASEAPEPVAPKPRRKATAAPTAESTAPKPAPRVRRSTRAASVAASESVSDSPSVPVIIEAVDASPVSDSPEVLRFDEEEVRVRAYLLSLARGDRPGSPDSDWFQAEREVALSRQL